MSGAGTLARLNILLSADSSEFEAAMQGVASKIEAAGEKMQDVGKTLSKNVTAPITAVGAALLGAAVRVGNMADALLDLEQQTGLSTTTLQEFRHVATVAGVAQDTMANAAMQLTRRLSAFGEESEQLQMVLGGLGVSVRNTDGSFREMDQIIPELIMELQSMEDITERNRIAQELFGRGAVDLAPVLGMTAEAFADARQEAHDLHLVLSKDALDSAEEFRKEFDKVKKQLSAVVAEVGLAVLPVMQSLVQLFQRHVVPALRSVARFINNLSPEFQMVLAAVAAIIAAIGPLLVIFGTLVKAAGLVAGALAAFNPVTIAVVAAIATVVAAGIALQQNWETIATFFGNMLEKVRSEFQAKLNSVRELLATLKTNSLDIVQSMMDAILGVFTGVLNRVKDTVTGAVDSVLGAFRRMSREAVGNSIIPDMLEMIEDQFDDMAEWMPAKTEAATTATTVEFSGMFDDVVNRAKAFVQDLGGDWDKLTDMLKSPFSTLNQITTDWRQFFTSLAQTISSFWNTIKGFWDKLTRFWEALTGAKDALGDGFPGIPAGGGFGGGFGGGYRGGGFFSANPGDMNVLSNMGSGGGGMSLEIGTLNIDARGTNDPDATGRSVARAFIEEMDRALGETTLRETRLDGTMVAL